MCVLAHGRCLVVQDVQTLWGECHSHSLVRVGEKVDSFEGTLDLTSKHHRPGERGGGGGGGVEERREGGGRKDGVRKRGREGEG